MYVSGEKPWILHRKSSAKPHLSQGTFSVLKFLSMFPNFSCGLGCKNYIIVTRIKHHNGHLTLSSRFFLMIINYLQCIKKVMCETKRPWHAIRPLDYYPANQCAKSMLPYSYFSKNLQSICRLRSKTLVGAVPLIQWPPESFYDC